MGTIMIIALIANICSSQGPMKAKYQGDSVEDEYSHDRRAAFAMKYYISSENGSANGDGSAGNPWNSLDSLNAYKFSPGDTVFFERGSSWSGSFEITASGTEEDPIVFTAYGSGDLPSLSNPDSGTNDGNAIRISASYITIEKLYVHDCGLSGPRTVAGIANFNREDHHIVVQHCEFKGCRVAVRLYAHDVRISNNYMHSPGGGINEWWGPMAIVGAGYNGEISFNHIEGFLAPNNYGYDGGAIELDDEGIHTNWKIHHNISLGNEGFLESYDDSECEDCTWGEIEICYNYSDDYQWFIDGPIGRDAIIENNTVLRVLPANTDFNWCISLHHRIPEASVRNNIFVLANGVTAFEWENPGSSTSDNIYFSVDNSLSNPKGYILKDGEIIADPLFVNYEERDLHLQEGSPAVDMAEASRYEFDLEGNPVPQGNAPDAGAFESSFVAGSKFAYENGKVSIFPNPSNGILQIENMMPNQQNRNLTIHDQAGKMVVEQNIRERISTIDITKLPKGVYYVNPGLSELSIPHILQ